MKIADRESKRLGSETPLWSFWLLDGGYTTEHYLTSVAKESSISPQLATFDNFERQGSVERTIGRHSDLQCFGPGHQNAMNLDKLGVWLGDCQSDQIAVNDISWNEVQGNYFEKTLGGINCSRAEPHALDAYTNETFVVQCAACNLDLASEIEMFGFDAKDPDDDEIDPPEMHKNVSHLRGL